MHFQITEIPIDVTALKEELLSSRCGAYTSFEGWVRNHHDGKSVASLEYSCYRTLAEKEGNRIITDTLKQFKVDGIRCHHRIGHLHIGDMAVYVGVAAAHRDAAFLACRFVIDEIKKSVPIWKKEHYTDHQPSWPSSINAQSID